MITKENKELYNKLRTLSVSDLELLKEISDEIIFEKFMNKIMEK